MAVPILLWQLGIAFGPGAAPAFDKSIYWFNVLIFSILIFVFGANVFIYEEWKTPLNNRAVQYFKTPEALLDSMSFIFKVACLALYAGFLWLVIRTYKKVVGARTLDVPSSRWNLLTLPLWLGLLVLAIRGGTGVMPINESAVYYSTHLFDNHAATNPGWSLCHSLIETRSTENRFSFMEDNLAQEKCLKILDKGQPSSTGLSFFDSIDTGPRNIVFLMLESHTAQVIEELGGEPGVCPNMSRLIREGILFQNIYGSGYRTDQGIVSVLAGYPAQPDQSIILLEDKASKLASIPKILKEKGYSTAFFYGGELTFANLGLWLANQRFDKIVSERDFSSAEQTQRWGADDGVVLNRIIQEINGMKQPFFASALTLSLHPPYDVPFQSQWTAHNDHDKFLNSAAFVDQALGAFFAKAATQTWYDQTIFVLVADHGASQPAGLGMDKPASRHIPLLIFGKPLASAWKGAKPAIFGNHHDIPATVLHMLYPDAALDADFPWSRDLFSRASVSSTAGNDLQRISEGFGYYTNENGLGWTTPRGKGFFEFGSQEWRIFEGKLDTTDQLNAQAYLQTLYNDFLAK